MRMRQKNKMFGCYKEAAGAGIKLLGVPSGDPAPYVTHVSLKTATATMLCEYYTNMHPVP